MGGYGITALAAYGVTGKLETILFYPAMALNMVLTTIVGQCIGAKRYDRAKAYMKTALGYGSAVLILLSLLVVCFAQPLSKLFIKSSGAAEIVAVYFKIVGVGYVLNTITNCFLGSLNGMGKPAKSMSCMILYYILIRMPLAWAFSNFGLGLDGIWVAVMVSHIIAAAAAVIITKIELRKQEHDLKPIIAD